MRSLNYYSGRCMCLFVRFFAVANLCHEASRGQAVIYTNSLPQPFLDLGVITWEQNGFISFNPAGAAICSGNICGCGVCTVKQLETSECLKYKQGRGGDNQKKNLCRRQYCLLGNCQLKMYVLSKCPHNPHHPTRPSTKQLGKYSDF